MDIQCPAVVVCLPPGQTPPESAGGHRVVAALIYDLEDLGTEIGLPVHSLPEGKFWAALQEIADSYRGEGLVLYAPISFLEAAGIKNASLALTSEGAERL